MTSLFRWVKRKAQESRQTEEARLRAEDARRRAEEAYRERQADVLSLLRRGQLPNVKWDSGWGLMPFRFMKSEHLVHVFLNVRYYEQRPTSGIDTRIDRGDGTLAVTTKHLYFHGERSFRIRFDKLVSIEGFADAVGVTRDRASGQPEFFVVGKSEGRFAYELLDLIPSLELGKDSAQAQPRARSAYSIGEGASEPDYYAILQVHPNAEIDIIEAAYRRLAQLYHPDRNSSPKAASYMAQINSAIAVLRDPAKRAAYDQRSSRRV